MQTKEIRQAFLDFFRNKQHQIVPSAPITVKNDPTLLFTNAGMNQFKDIFLGVKKADYTRVADSQKCLRVSGKHNDLEEVGVDHYHHTMFEMLGTWSFGDYFKKEAIEMAWNFLTNELKLEKERLYVTIFEGDENLDLTLDTEAKDIWKQFIEENKILPFNKKDNFWEMGDTGPCGPCSEIHYDMRSIEDRHSIDGASLVNQDHEEVIEIWNLVFMEYNRLANGQLEKLPNKHVDTGMGLERLARAVQKVDSNYKIDSFQQLIRAIEINSQQKYGEDRQKDIAFRVIADHIRAIAFCIADGQMPSNIGAGYVVRRILRRAVRFTYSFLNQENAMLYLIIPALVDEMGTAYPELQAQKDFIQKVIKEEEETFLRTLVKGIDILNKAIKKEGNLISGETAFLLYDTYGFPIDLTLLVASESNCKVDVKGFEEALDLQKNRSKKDAEIIAGDWIIVKDDDKEEFVGYDRQEVDLVVTKTRTQKVKNKDVHHVVFNITPFYAESGGQIGDRGKIVGRTNQEVIEILDTKNENGIIVHKVNRIPSHLEQIFHAQVDIDLRQKTTQNHSATHLLHAALRKHLGTHVVQRGSLVNENKLRFDFSHFAALTKDEINKIENEVNQKIMQNINLDEQRDVPLNEAQKMGAMSLFGEKYGDLVRVITFDSSYSIELCGGTHVQNTGQIGLFKILSESSVAAGIRRIEAVSGQKAFEYIKNIENDLEEVNQLLGNPKNLTKAIQDIQTELKDTKSKLDIINLKLLSQIKAELLTQVKNKNGLQIIISQFEFNDLSLVKNLAFNLKNTLENLMAIFAYTDGQKAGISVMLSEKALEMGFNANEIIKQLSPLINGGGGGQKFFAQAGGKDIRQLNEVILEAQKIISTKI